MEVKEIKTVVNNLTDFIEVPNGIERLRSAVLDLAVRGLLTEQKKSDGNAEDLYQAIQKVKGKVDSGNKKYRPVVPMTEDEISFEIPKNWKATRLDEVFDVRDGTHDTPKYVDSGFPLVTSKNLSSGRLEINNVKYISEKDYVDINRRSQVDQNDILFAMIGSIGNPVLVDIKPEFSIKNVALFKYFSTELASPSFLLLYLRFAAKDIQIKSSGAVQSFVSLGYLRKYPFMLPPLAEQKRIVERVEELMKLIDQLEVDKKERDEVRGKMAISAFYSFGTEHNDFALKHLTELVKTPSDIDELEKSILSLAVSGKLTPQDPEDGNTEDLYQEIKKEKEKLDTGNKKSKLLQPISKEEVPFSLPSNWKWVRLGELMIIERGGSPRPIKSFITDDEDGVNWIKIGDTKGDNKYISSTKEKITKEGISRSREVKEGDFVLSNSMSFGRPYIMKTNGCIHDGWLLLRPLSEDIDKDFLYSLLSSSLVQAQFKEKAAGAVVQNLNIELVRPTLIPLPPVGEQRRIVSKVDELMVMVQKLREIMDK